MVDGFVGGLQRGRGFFREFKTLGVRLVERGNLPVQIRERTGERRCGRGRRRSSHSQEQGKELAAASPGVDMQVEFERMHLRALLVGSHDPSGRAGDRDRSGESVGVGVERVEAGASLPHPLRVRRAERWHRPHLAHVGGEAEDQVHRAHRVHLEEHDGAGPGGRCIGRKHDLPDGDGDVRVGDGGAVGAYFDLAGHRVQVERHRIVFDIGFDGEVREQLDRKYPGLEGALLLADEDPFRAGDGKRLASFDMLAEHRSFVAQWERGNGLRRGGNGRAEPCEDE